MLVRPGVMADENMDMPRGDNDENPGQPEKRFEQSYNSQRPPRRVAMTLFPPKGQVVSLVDDVALEYFGSQRGWRYLAGRCC